jgi:hypothetical protein
MRRAEGLDIIYAVGGADARLEEKGLHYSQW